MSSHRPAIHSRAARAPAFAAVTALLLLAACRATPPADDAIRPHVPDTDRAPSHAEAARTGESVWRVLYVPADGFAYTGEDGRLTGVTVEIMREIATWVHDARGIDVAIEFVAEPDWRTFYARVRDGTGGVFGLGNVTITDERRTELAFSPPYLTNVAVLITHESVDALHTLDDIPTRFAALRPLAFEGTLHETRLRALRDAYLPATPVELASSNAGILERVAGGGYFAYIDAYNFWRAREQHAPLRRHEAGDDPAEEFGIIMPLDNDWAPLLDEFFARAGGYRDTPAYRRILECHLGTPLAQALEDARLHRARAHTP